jgi:hypothetical protein
MSKIKGYTSMEQEIKELRFKISGQNRRYLSAVALSNRCKSILSARSKSDKFFLCKLIRLYLAIFAVKNRSKSKLIEGYCFETFENQIENQIFGYSALLLNPGVR